MTECSSTIKHTTNICHASYTHAYTVMLLVTSGVVSSLPTASCSAVQPAVPIQVEVTYWRRYIVRFSSCSMSRCTSIYPNHGSLKTCPPSAASTRLMHREHPEEGPLRTLHYGLNALQQCLPFSPPDKHSTPEFVAYQRVIVRAARNFEGSSWVTHDICYRRNAGKQQGTKDLQWSCVDSALYHDAFTGRARSVP